MRQRENIIHLCIHWWQHTFAPLSHLFILHRLSVYLLKSLSVNRVRFDYWCVNISKNEKCGRNQNYSKLVGSIAYYIYLQYTIQSLESIFPHCSFAHTCIYILEIIYRGGKKEEEKKRKKSLLQGLEHTHTAERVCVCVCSILLAKWGYFWNVRTFWLILTNSNAC